jgi:protein-disulfide isomerase
VKLQRYLLLMPFILAILLATACGPAAPAEIPPPMLDSSGENEEDASAEDGPVVAADNANGESNSAASGTQDVGGITVGFTPEGRPYRGDLNAPVLMEEFSDFQCPFCARFTEQTMPELLENQIASGELLLIYYDFPLENIHPQAFAAANAARCAGEQNPAAFWEMHDLLYANIAEWGKGNPNEALVNLGASLDLDQVDFAACVKEMRHGDLVQADLDLGLSRGIRSTPSFFLNDQLLVGAQPAAVFNEAIAAIAGGETIAEVEPPQESPLRPPRVAPEAVEINLDNYAAAQGDPDAPVTVVEFTDYQCPYCQRYAQDTLPQLISEKVDSGEIYYVIKDLPLDSIHPNARAAAAAARCAGEQDAYWEMHDLLFETQQSWGAAGSLPAEIFTDLAVGLDLDAEAFGACINDQSTIAAVQANVDEARQLGADSTPYFFINGLPIFGAQPYELFDYAIGLAEEGTLAAAYVPPEPSLENVNAIGDPDAPVTIIEYTDYQCPFCSRHFEQTFTKIKEKYVDSGQVYYVFKDFPLSNIHPQAILAAEAARCAGDQGEYLAMHDRLFQEQSAWNNNADAANLFNEFAEDIGLNAETFAGCLSSEVHREAVLADLEEGTNQGITGTPAFIINGHSLSGAQPYAIFEQAIEQFLNESV